MLSYFYSIALAPYFAIRPFLSMLTTALVVYFSGISFGPAWLIYDSMLFLLFGLAVVEFFVVRHADTKIFITEFGRIINPLCRFQKHHPRQLSSSVAQRYDNAFRCRLARCRDC